MVSLKMKFQREPEGIRRFYRSLVLSLAIIAFAGQSCGSDAERQSAGDAQNELRSAIASTLQSREYFAELDGSKDDKKAEHTAVVRRGNSVQVKGDDKSQELIVIGEKAYLSTAEHPSQYELLSPASADDADPVRPWLAAASHATRVKKDSSGYQFVFQAPQWGNEIVHAEASTRLGLVSKLHVIGGRRRIELDLSFTGVPTVRRPAPASILRSTSGDGSCATEEGQRTEFRCIDQSEQSR